MTEGTVPSSKDINEWKALFISGELTTDYEDIHHEFKPQIQLQITNSDVLDEKEFFDYLHFKSDWKLNQQEGTPPYV